VNKATKRVKDDMLLIRKVILTKPGLVSSELL